jgi:endonuclease/exonuclease/phosphatase (EEP) superfamily protein YafD
LTSLYRDGVPLTEHVGVGRFDRAVQLVAAGALVLTAASFLGSRYWLLELLTHFRFQYVCGALLLFAIAGIRRRPGSSFIALFVATANLIPMLPYVMPGTASAQAGQFSLRIMSLNVHFRNGDHAAVRALIEHEDPDIIGLSEVSQGWIDGLVALAAEYPHSVLRPEDGANGLALYSRVPLHELETSPYVEDGIQTAISVDVELPATVATVTLAHLMAPTSPGKAALRNLQIEKITEMAGTYPNDNQILIGDLNITPWSPYYAQLQQDAGLANAAAGRGYLPTWPASFYALQIPIDHILLSDGFQVERIRRAARFGSDHLPIVADVSIPGTGPDQPR